jgi:hypothetical protein
VVVFDTGSSKLVLDKSGVLWEFSTTRLGDWKVTKGDTVTVYYQMVAKDVSPNIRKGDTVTVQYQLVAQKVETRR